MHTFITSRQLELSLVYQKKVNYKQYRMQQREFLTKTRRRAHITPVLKSLHTHTHTRLTLVLTSLHTHTHTHTHTRTHTLTINKTILVHTITRDKAYKLWE